MCNNNKKKTIYLLWYLFKKKEFDWPQVCGRQEIIKWG